MAFKGITFAGQNVTPKNDGALYQAHYSDGIIDGCSMAISGDDLVIQSGHFIAGGRVCHVDGATNVDLSGRGLTTGYIQVIMNYDLSQGEGSQWYTTFVESATTTFPALTQDDINGTGTLYQLQLAVVQISGGNLTSLYSSLPLSFVTRNIEGLTEVFFAGSLPDGTLRTGIAEKVDAGFVSLRGMSTTVGGDITLYTDNHGIYLRPQGIGTSGGQVWLDTAGQLHGGSTRSQATGSGRSISGTSNYDILTISDLDSTGLYVIQAHCIYNLTNNTGQFVWCKFNGFWSESKWIPMKTNWELNHVALVWGQSSYTFQMSPQGSSNGGTVSNVVINAFQIA